MLVGYTAAGLNDAKPTPVDPVMPGVEVLAEATEALVAGSAIRVPPAWLKYVIAALLVALTAFVFFRGEPHNDIDSIFVATNVLLLGAAFIGLTFFAYFFDVFAAVGFVSLVFGLCRIYAKIQRGRAVGNGDYLPDFDPARDRWLAVARLHFVPDAGLDARLGGAPAPRVSPAPAAIPVRRHGRRHARGHRRGKDLAARRPERPRGADVARRERGRTRRAAAARDLARLERNLAEQDARLPDDGTVQLAFGSGEIDGRCRRRRRPRAAARS